MRADARARVQEPLQICLECRGKSKNRDELMNYTVRVMLRRVSCVVTGYEEKKFFEVTTKL